MTATNAQSERAGALVAGKYRLGRPLGEGAFGEVWLSEQVADGQKVVVKLLHPQWARVPSIVERFRREAVASNRVHHPNVCRVFEYGMAEDETPFIVMELLDGGTLKEALAREGAMPLARIAERMAPVCEAVAAAHQVGIVHRDLKPDNVMLAYRDGAAAETPVVLDFGIAKLLDATEKLTQTGSMMGTPAYMSPEQCQGRTDIGPAADVYSLAIMCYEMMVGRPPFSSKTLAEMAMKHVLEPPPPIAGVPQPLADVIAKCLAKDPKDRPPAGLLAGALREGARTAPEARGHALGVAAASQDDLPVASKNPTGAGSTAVTPRKIDSHEAETVLSPDAGRQVEALVNTARRTGRAQPVPQKRPLPTVVFILGLFVLAGVGALVGWLLRH